MSRNDTAPMPAVNPSPTIESTEVADQRYWQQWTDANKEAIETYNARIAREGLPLAKYRSF